ncbi:hypothetical protein [Moorena sp. SIO3A5]|uniref:hypothetical protein n=1 Tax=Moorena sp. SIO3A5 TaxID=2607822 RepID=UPI002580CE05|nr:hypothetical protein [Moorena sp. SIO3A5]
MSEVTRKDLDYCLTILSTDLKKITEQLSVIIDREYECHKSKTDVREDINSRLASLEKIQQEQLKVQKEALEILKVMSEGLGRIS